MPKARIDGTQIPINIAAMASPSKYSASEKTRERNAAMNNNLSAVVNFLSMRFLVLMYIRFRNLVNGLVPILLRKG